MVIAFSIVVDVLMRWLFNSPIMAVDDLNKFNVAIVVASFFPLGLVAKQFVTIRFLGKAMGTRSALWLEVVGAVGTLIVFFLLAWQFFMFTSEVQTSGLATVVLEVHQAPWWWAVTAIIVLCVPTQIAVLLDSLYQAVTGIPREDSLQQADSGA